MVSKNDGTTGARGAYFSACAQRCRLDAAHRSRHGRAGVLADCGTMQHRASRPPPRVPSPMQSFDLVVVGAGAAGLFCAGLAGQRGLRVLLIDHAERLAEKIRISGGGRCNFTNREAGPANFLSENPNFCRSALARYTSQDFIALVQKHGIAFHEKHKGQLFCDDSSDQIIQMLVRECEAGGVQRWQPGGVEDLRSLADGGFELDSSRGPVRATRVAIATGGLSIPKIGATDWG